MVRRKYRPKDQAPTRKRKTSFAREINYYPRGDEKEATRSAGGRKKGTESRKKPEMAMSQEKDQTRNSENREKKTDHRRFHLIVETPPNPLARRNRNHGGGKPGRGGDRRKSSSTQPIIDWELGGNHRSPAKANGTR